MRTIDADALYEEMYQTPYDNILDGTIGKEKILRAIIDAPTVGGWISVEDKLPEGARNYIICILAGDGTIYVTTGTYDWRYERWSDEIGCIWPPDRVTHWMPLPAPPKE